jgi:hypothetical protein
MQTTATPTQEQVIQGLYNHAAHQLFTENRLDIEVIDDLVSKGLDRDSASAIVTDLQNKMDVAKKERANKDMLYGALWCVGGTVATLANIGFIFWGAILFGGIQFIKGLVNSMD